MKLLCIILHLLFCNPISYQTEEISFRHDSHRESSLQSSPSVPDSYAKTKKVPTSSDHKENFLLLSKESALSNLLKPKITKRKRRGCKEFKNFIGSNLFDGDRKVCFSPEDVNVLAARREFELSMVPRNMKPTILDDKSVCVIMRYFCYGHLLIRCMKDCSTSRVLKKAFFDTFGAFMHYFLLPVVKMSFYAGNVKLKTVRKVVDYYQKCRFFLNTNGNAWRSPLHFPLDNLKNISFASVIMSKNTACDMDTKVDYCAGLDLITPSPGNDIVDENMIVAMPRIDLEDSDGYLGNLWLPYSKKSTYSLRSCKSVFVLIKFYKKVSQCYFQKQISKDPFDQKLKQWISDNLLAHLYDEAFYPGLGGVIGLYRYLESLENKCEDKTKQKTEYNEEEQEQENAIEKRDDSKVSNGLKQRRRTSKFMDLESKTKQMTSGEDCELNWLRQIHGFGKKPKSKGKNKNKNGKKSKKVKDKNKKWFSKWFNWSKWFDWLGGSSDSESSGKWGWWKLLKYITKYVIFVLVLLIIICILCKLISVIITVVFGVGGSIGGDCFGVMWRLASEFLKKLFTVLAIVFAFITLGKCSNKTTPTTQPKREPIKSAPPEIKVEKSPTPNLAPKTAKKPKKSKNTPSKKSVQIEIQEVPKTSRAPKSSVPVGTQTSDEKNQSNESDSKSRSDAAKEKKDEKRGKGGNPPRKTKGNKRLRGGQSYIRIESSTDSSPDSKERTSWKTFYDF